MSHNDIEAVNEFYGDRKSADIVRKCQLLFTWLKRLSHPISETEITKAVRKNQAFANITPNFICALKTYIVLPSSARKAERLFSTLHRLITYL